MTERLILQKNGYFAVWTSATDDIYIWNATAEELVEHFATEAANRARKEARRWIAGKSPGRKTWTPEEMIDEVQESARERARGILFKPD